MVELLAVIAGIGACVAVLAAGGFELGGGEAERQLWRLATHLAGPQLPVEILAAGAGAAGAWLLTGMPALVVAGAALGVGALHGALRVRALRLRRELQDAVLAAVRTLRQLLQTGAVGVPAGIAVLAERGPVLLRTEFAGIQAARGSGAAWAAARRRIGEPIFDLLAAAVLVQRPSGGELSPLFRELEESVSAVYEVEREAAALQVQARSASTLILCLPLAFLAIMCVLRSPYLDVYRSFAGQAFLAAMLAVMGGAHLLIRRWLLLPEEPRLELADA
ncbi:MAG: hypothetical protein E6I85_02450 [Chloroflexi bacterium]|nr:MAG: hypothetical protein E6I85_02450 [Chloroflexota bacterium]